MESESGTIIQHQLGHDKTHKNGRNQSSSIGYRVLKAASKLKSQVALKIKKLNRTSNQILISRLRRSG